MKKVYTSLFLLLVSIALHAEPVEVEELTYHLYSNATASVAANQSTELSGEMSIPATILVNDTAYRVVSIATFAFINCTGLTSVNLPDDITEIGEEAFLYCSKLTALTLPKSLSNIGVRAFLSCDGLTELQLPESLTNIGEYAFQDCSGLTAINIPEKITEIPTGAFMNCCSRSMSPEPEKCLFRIVLQD